MDSHIQTGIFKRATTICLLRPSRKDSIVCAAKDLATRNPASGIWMASARCMATRVHRRACLAKAQRPRHNAWLGGHVEERVMRRLHLIGQDEAATLAWLGAVPRVYWEVLLGEFSGGGGSFGICGARHVKMCSTATQWGARWRAPASGLSTNRPQLRETSSGG